MKSRYVLLEQHTETSWAFLPLLRHRPCRQAAVWPTRACLLAVIGLSLGKSACSRPTFLDRSRKRHGRNSCLLHSRCNNATHLRLAASPPFRRVEEVMPWSLTPKRALPTYLADGMANRTFLTSGPTMYMRTDGESSLRTRVYKGDQALAAVTKCVSMKRAAASIFSVATSTMRV